MKFLNRQTSDTVIENFSFGSKAHIFRASVLPSRLSIIARKGTQQSFSFHEITYQPVFFVEFFSCHFPHSIDVHRRQDSCTSMIYHIRKTIYIILIANVIKFTKRKKQQNAFSLYVYHSILYALRQFDGEATKNMYFILYVCKYSLSYITKLTSNHNNSTSNIFNIIEHRLPIVMSDAKYFFYSQILLIQFQVNFN